MHLVCLQHVPVEGPALIARWARRRGHRLSRRLVWSAPLHGCPNGVIVLGGPMNVGDVADHPWLIGEKRWLARQIARGVPLLGICLGAQLLARALGAAVRTADAVEIGWFPVRRRADAESSVIGNWLPATFPALHWHSDTFDTPDGAVPLARSEACANQGFDWHGQVVGLQFHLEQTPAGIAALASVSPGDLAAGDPWVQSVDALTKPAPHWRRAEALLVGVLDRLFPGGGRNTLSRI